MVGLKGVTSQFPLQGLTIISFALQGKSFIVPIIPTPSYAGTVTESSVPSARDHGVLCWQDRGSPRRTLLPRRLHHG